MQIKLFFRFIKFIFPYRKRWLLVFILGNTAALVDLLNPYLAKLVIDEGIGKRELRSFILILLIGGSLFLIKGLVLCVKEFLNDYIDTMVTFDLSKSLFKHIQSFSLDWFNDKSTGEHLYKINKDTEATANFIAVTVPQALSVLPVLIGTVVIVFYLNWKMALFSFCLTLFLYAPSYYITKKIRKICEDLVNSFENIFKILIEIFSRAQLIKVFGKEASAIKKYLRSLIANIRINLQDTKWEIIISFVKELSAKIIIGLITLYGGYQVIKGNMSLGSLTAIMLYLYSLVNLQGQATGFFESVILISISCRRLSEILDEKPSIIESKYAKAPIFRRGEVVFKNVDFGYKKGEHVLRNMSFRIEGSSHIAIVGPSGCGKTTILNLLVRCYDPWEGQIFIDNYNIKDLKLTSLKSQIGFVLQEPFLWNDTVENNIRYGREDATTDEIRRAGEISGVEEFVRNLDKRYATIIGENACKLSEGQKQKIAIARALIKNTKILILDEALSSIDSKSEEKIISSIKTHQRDLTLITVSHRLSTVMSADKVYYLFKPNEMIIDTAQNLLEFDKEFPNLFIGQDKILV